MSDPHYKQTDRAIRELNRKAVRRFREARRKTLLNMDELNIIQTTRTLYEGLASDNRAGFLDLARAVYRSTEPKGDREPDLIWLLAFLAGYDPVTKYVYDNEVTRKRDYLAESVEAAPSKGPEFTRANKYWMRMTGHYADSVTREATLKAYRDAGVKRVMWVTDRDEKVCAVCGPRDGKVYDIDKAPPFPHWNCRCILRPAD